MDAILFYITFVTIILFLYVIPFIFTKGESRIPLSLVITTILFYLFGLTFIFLVDTFNLDERGHPIAANINMSLFAILPVILPLNVVLALIYFFIRKLGNGSKG